MGGTVTTGTNESSGGVDVHKVKRAMLGFQGSTTKKGSWLSGLERRGTKGSKSKREYVVGGMACGMTNNKALPTDEI